MSPAAAAAVVLLAGATASLAARSDESLRRAKLLLGGYGTPLPLPLPSAGPKCSGIAARVRQVVSGLRRCVPPRLRPEALSLPAGLVLALVARSFAPAVVALIAVVAAARWRRRSSAERAAAARRAAVIEFCAILAGELRAGLPPDAALCRAVEEADRARPGGLGRAAVTGVLAAARFGGDVPAALRSAAAGPAGDGLSGLAACWQVAVDSGSGLADAVDRVAAALRADRDQREDLRAQLAGVRSTAALLTALPLFAMVLGSAMGADPARVLLHTRAGLGCLIFGALLEGAGASWTARIVRGAEGGD